MRLSDCFMEFIAYVNFIVEGEGPNIEDYDKVRGEVVKILEKSERCATGLGFQHEDYALAKFAICAWADERILASHWPGKGRWQREQLQRTYFNTTNAGEEFFERLNALGPHQKEVREIYYLCLCLGFQGRYCHQGDEPLLEQLKLSNLKLITGASVGIPSLEVARMFPDAYPRGEDHPQGAQIRTRRLSTTNILALAMPVAIFGILYVVYTFILDGVGKSILDLMRFQ